MNRSISTAISMVARERRCFSKLFNLFSQKYFFSQSTQNNEISRRFAYGQGGEFIFDLRNRTYSLSFQTIWQDYSQIKYSPLQNNKQLFILQKSQQVTIDDIDLSPNQNQYNKLHFSIPQDYTIRGKINGSIKHLNNNISTKTRSNSYEIQISGYKNIYQWLNMQCQQMIIKNINGQVSIDNLTVKNAKVEAQVFKSTKLLFSGEINLKVTNRIQIRSVIAYQDALTKIYDSEHVYLQSLSGRIQTKNVRNLKIDRLLSLKDGICIECDRIQDHIIVQTGSGTIQCLKQKVQILQQKIKLGKMHKGKLDFNYSNDQNSPYSKVHILLS